MSFQITIDSVRNTLDDQGSTCPVSECQSSDVRIEHIPGNQVECGKENFTCADCNAEWTVMLYAAKLESIMTPDGTRHHPWNDTGRNGVIEKGALSQMVCPKDPVVDALKEFVKQMRMGSVNGKGEALAKLAFLARVDLSSLLSNQPSILQELPSDTE